MTRVGSSADEVGDVEQRVNSDRHPALGDCLMHSVLDLLGLVSHRHDRLPDLHARAVCQRGEGRRSRRRRVRGRGPSEVNVEIVSDELSHAAEVHAQHSNGVPQRLQLSERRGSGERGRETDDRWTSLSTISNCR
jgi:hypothetical protein